MPRLAQHCFQAAIVFFIFGIVMGLQMGISGNHNVIGPHAHSNLLGWVSMALFGVYYALNPTKAQSKLARIQFIVYAIGVVIMIPSLYLLYIGYPAFEPIVAASSIVVLVGALLFAAVVFSKELAPARVPAE